ncbi:MAG: type II secretion system protein GspM, partial [Nitrospiria bacterium]
GGIAIGILCAYIIFSTLYQKHIESLQALSEREELYRTLSGSVISHADIMERIKVRESRINDLETGLLNGEKPNVAVAELQEVFKSLSSRGKVIVTSQKQLPFVERGAYTKIPVEFTFKADLGQLKDILYEIENSKTLMGIRMLHIRTSDREEAGKEEIVMLIEGAIKK